MRQTSEERAREIAGRLFQLYRDEDAAVAGGVSVMWIALALREAERDALERAAAAFDDEPAGDVWFTHNVATRLRALKDEP